MANKNRDKLLICPDCESDKVTVSILQRIMANTEEHYCYSSKSHDADSESVCLDCRWVGRRDQLLIRSEHIEAKR